MDTISQNILFFLTLTATWIYLMLWAKLSDGPFERSFCFHRMKNWKKEMVLAGKLIAGISTVFILLYYVLCGVLEQSPVSPLNITVIITTPLHVFLCLESPMLGNKVKSVAYVICVVTWIPVILLAMIAIKKIGLDVYCGYASLIFLLADIGMAVKVRKEWMEGDL